MTPTCSTCPSTFGITRGDRTIMLVVNGKPMCSSCWRRVEPERGKR